MGLRTLKRELEGSSVKESFAETVPPALGMKHLEPASLVGDRLSREALMVDIVRRIIDPDNKDMTMLVVPTMTRCLMVTHLAVTNLVTTNLVVTSPVVASLMVTHLAVTNLVTTNLVVTSIVTTSPVVASLMATHLVVTDLVVINLVVVSLVLIARVSLSTTSHLE
jgi:hypothetical protein